MRTCAARRGPFGERAISDASSPLTHDEHVVMRGAQACMGAFATDDSDESLAAARLP
jgi:hypothetical protein